MILFDNKSSLPSSELSTVIILVTPDKKAICFEYSQEKEILLSIELLADLSEIDAKYVSLEEIQIRLASSTFTLVPSILVNADNNTVFSNFNFENDSGSIREHTFSYDEKIAILFNLNQKEGHLFQKVSKHPIQHFTKELIAFVSKNNEDHFLVVIVGSHLFVALQWEQKLQLMNVYPVNSMDEVLYYCMLIAQEYALNPSSIKLTTVGDFTEDGLLHKNLSDYFIHVHPLQSAELSDARYTGLIKLLLQ